MLATPETSASAAPPASSIAVSRVSGADRYATAVALAQAGYPHGAPIVFLANGTEFPDALSAGPAAAKTGGPLLLIPGSGMPSAVAAELQSLNPAKVELVGGTAVIPSAVESEVQALLPSAAVDRLAGADRYGTSQAINTVFSKISTTYLTSGLNYPDALSAGANAAAEGAPIMLVNGALDSLDQGTRDELLASGVQNIVIAGGTSAVSAGIQAELVALNGSPTVTRLGGADRYSTSQLIAKRDVGAATHAFLVSGEEFPDGLTTSAIAGAEHAPLFTVEPGCVPNQTYQELLDLGVTSVTLVGGTAVLSPDVASLHTCQPFKAAPKLSIVAGTQVFPHSGSALESSLDEPTAVAEDAAGNIFIADTGNHVVEKVTPSGTMSVFAGDGFSGTPTPGSATFSDLENPTGLATDSAGNLYIADEDYIEKVTPTGSLSVLAGDGISGAPTAGLANQSDLQGVEKIALDSDGDVYASGSSNIEKITAAGALSIVLNQGTSALAVDPSGNLYFCDSEDDYIKRLAPDGAISIFAGNFSRAYPTPGPATSSSIGDPTDLSTDSAGDLYIADSYGSDVAEVTPDGTLSITADLYQLGVSIPPSAPIGNSLGSAVDPAGDLLIAESADDEVQELPANGALHTIAGNRYSNVQTPGAALATSLGEPSDVAVDSSGNLYVADAKNEVIDKISPSGQLSVVAGNGNGGSPTPGPATASDLGWPRSLAVDSSGNIYVADIGNSVIEKITPAGELSIVAGRGTAGVPFPGEPAVDSNLSPNGIAVDPSGNLFISDSADGIVMKVSRATGILTIVAGYLDSYGGVHGQPTPGPATSTALEFPTGVGTDGAGNVFIADAHYVVKVTPSGVLSIVAGNGIQGEPSVGPALQSSLQFPSAVAVDPNGDVYISDVDHVEEVTPSGSLSVAAGNGNSSAPTPGSASASGLLPLFSDQPLFEDAITYGLQLGGIASDSNGNVYLATGYDIAKLSR
nr:cell wall-binding repeat-containing protein [Gryllotalpicola protaetiae]